MKLPREFVTGKAELKLPSIKQVNSLGSNRNKDLSPATQSKLGMAPGKKDKEYTTQIQSFIVPRTGPS